jgi:hypothetical protein
MPSRFLDGIMTHPASGRTSWFGNPIDTPTSSEPRYGLKCKTYLRQSGKLPKWPRSRMYVTENDQGVWQSFGSLAWGAARCRINGTNTRYRIDGIARDAYGTPVPGCTVLCLGQVLGDIVYITTSDTTGAYLCYSPYYGAANIIVSYKAAPDQAGATINVQGY